jgi:hypothetical protein
MNFLKGFHETWGGIDGYETARRTMDHRNPNLLKLETLKERFFGGDGGRLLEAVENFNHKILKITP